MAGAAERNFANYYLGDNVYELAHGLIPEIAARLEVPIGAEPNSDDLGILVGKAGKNKVLRDSQPVDAIDRDTMFGFVERAGVQQALSRSLWAPEHTAEADKIDAVVITGGVANWQDRTANLVSYSPHQLVHVAVGERVMESATEVTNPNVQRLHTELGRYPTEAEYAGKVVVPRLVAAKKDVMLHSFNTTNGDELAELFFMQSAQLWNKRLAFARVANAGIQLAVQMRQAARKLNSKFDTDQTNPQAYVLTDAFPLAATPEAEQQPTRFQKVQPALRQTLLTAKLLHEVAGVGF